MRSFGYGFEGYSHGPLQPGVVDNHWLAHGPADYAGYRMDFGQNEQPDAYSVHFGEDPNHTTIDQTARTELIFNLGRHLVEDVNYY